MEERQKQLFVFSFRSASGCRSLPILGQGDCQNIALQVARLQEKLTLVKSFSLQTDHARHIIVEKVNSDATDSGWGKTDEVCSARSRGFDCVHRQGPVTQP
jgi:hypothetical protein